MELQNIISSLKKLSFNLEVEDIETILNTWVKNDLISRFEVHEVVFSDIIKNVFDIYFRDLKSLDSFIIKCFDDYKEFKKNPTTTKTNFLNRYVSNFHGDVKGNSIKGLTLDDIKLLDSLLNDYKS